MHILRGHAVNLALRFGDSLENAQRVLFDERRDFTCFDQGANLPVAAAMRVVMSVAVIVFGFVMMMRMRALSVFMLMPMPMSVFMLMLMLALLVRMHRTLVDGKPHSFHALPFLPLEVHVKISDVQLREFPFQGGRFDTEIAQRADGHVTADPGETIEKQNSHIGGRMNTIRRTGKLRVTISEGERAR